MKELLVNAFGITWYELMKPMLHHDIFKKILKEVGKNRDELCPHTDNVFKAFQLCPPEKLKVVIVGQDPYYTVDRKQILTADGLAFSSGRPRYRPPSLQEIFKAIEHDYGVVDKTPSLERWATQGVLLFNTSLTTILKKSGFHQDLWRPFAEYVISCLNILPQDIVIMLWGEHAKSLKPYLEEKENRLILEAPHPAAGRHNGKPELFRKASHFITCNTWLKEPVNWNQIKSN